MFSNRLQELRKSLNLSQSSLANELGVAQQTIAQWEKGTREPNIEMLIKISDFFEVTLDDLLGCTRLNNFAKMLDEVDKVEKKEIKSFLNKLYEDTKAKKVHWHRYSDKFKIPEDTDGIINYNLSFITEIDALGEIILFYCLNPDNHCEDYTIMPEIHTQGDVLVLPCDPVTQRSVRKLYSLLQEEKPSQIMRKLSNFIREYTNADR